MKKVVFLLATICALSSCKKNANTETTTASTEQTETVNTERIVSLDGAVTETLAALGAEKNIVGTDVTSIYPESLKEHATNLGHNRSITVESILALEPTAVFGTAKEMNPTVKEQLEKAHVPVIEIEQEYSVKGTQDLIKTIADKIGNKDYEKLSQHIADKIKNVPALDKKPKVLFIYARGTGTMMVAGKGTPVHEMIELAGGENAAADLTDYKPLTPEALLTTNPDVLLLFDSGLESLGGAEGLLKVEGVAATNAGKNKKIITMNGALLTSFGPRLGEAVEELNQKLR